MAGPYVGQANLKLDYSKGYADLIEDDNGVVQEVEGPLEVAQSDELAVRMAQLGYPFDPEEGFPYFKYRAIRFFDGLFDMARLDIRSVISRDKRNKALTRTDVGWKNRDNRQMFIDFAATLHNGETLNSSFFLDLRPVIG